jgi:hypothetical protein
LLVNCWFGWSFDGFCVGFIGVKVYFWLVEKIFGFFWLFGFLGVIFFGFLVVVWGWFFFLLVGILIFVFGE